MQQRRARQWHLGITLALVLPVLAAATKVRARDAEIEADADEPERPLMKVVKMLQDLKKGIETDAEADKEVHEELTCWCETNIREKTQSVSDANAKIPELQGFIQEAAAQIDELEVRRKDAADARDSNQKALREAQSLREKDANAFHEEEKGLIMAIGAAGQAITVLSEQHPELVQVRTAARSLQKARILSMGVLRGPAESALRRFLTEANLGDSGVRSFLQRPPGAKAGFKSYKSQSGQVFGILKQMKADFEKSLTEARESEKSAVAEFKELQAAKTSEIQMGNKLVVELDEQTAELGEKRAQALRELQDTKEQLVLDHKFLKEVKDKCTKGKEDYEATLKSRNAEAKAVVDTIVILNNDMTFDLFERSFPVGFLQVEQAARAEERMRRARAISMLRVSDEGEDSPRLMLLATRMHIDAMPAVHRAIDKMVVQLKAQQQDEVERKDWCVKQINENKASTAAATDKKSDLDTEITDLRKTSQNLQEQIEAVQAEAKKLDQQREKASDIRESEHAEFERTVTDQRLVQMVLRKALTRLRQTYIFLQAHQQAVDTNGYEPKKEAGQVLAAIETIIASAKKTEDLAVREERDSQAAYETFMKDSNALIVNFGKKASNLSEALARTTASLLNTKATLKETSGELESLKATLADLRSDCDFITDNFDTRQAARSEEINGLREAKSVLRGAK